MVTLSNPRSPLDAASLRARFASAQEDLPTPMVLGTTASTNSDAARLAANDAPDWTVVVADHQTSGRGRLDRTWDSEPGTALLYSLLVRPPSSFTSETLGWVPLMAGVAVAQCLRSIGVPAELKWPNDVVIDSRAHDGGPRPRKLAGILVERHGQAVIIGVGLNVAGSANELPVPHATSLEAQGCTETDRISLLINLITALRELWFRWVGADGNVEACGLADQYRALCLTIGHQVRVQVAKQPDVHGQAVGIDAHGRLQLVSGDDRRIVIAAGDVIHLR